MYKVLLADEEGVALEALRVMIDNEYGEECDIRLAVNASQMDEIFTKFLPDILFINIQMTGLRGISSIRELHVRQPQCLFVIVSYTKKIDYGREGLNMGVHGYMTKPLKHDQVIVLLKKYFNLLDVQYRRAETEKYNKEQWDNVIPMLESALVSEILFPDPLDNNLSLYLSMLNVKHQKAWIMHLKYSQINEHGTMCNPIGSVVQLSNKQIYFRKVVKAFFPGAIVGPILANHVVILVPCPFDNFTEEEASIRQKRVDDMTYQLHKKMQLYFKSTLSDIMPIENIRI